MSHNYLFPSLNEDQNMILDSVAEFVAQELEPRAEAIDHEASIPDEISAQIAELGLRAICIPEEKGGAGFDQLSYQMALAEIARGSASCALQLALQASAFLEPLALAGAESSSAFEAVATGAALGALAVQEDEGGFDACVFKTTVTEEDGSLRLLGKKCHVLGGAEASEFLVFAQEGEGMSAFLINRESEGLVIGESVARLGMRAVSAVDLSFNAVSVNDGMRVGTAGKAAELLTTIESRLSLALAAIAIGIMKAASKASAQYATERRQFRRPISDFDAIRERLSSAEIGQATVLNLVASAARAIDLGEDASQLIRIAKVVAGEFAMKATDDALQVYGGYGFSQEYPAERFYRDARYIAVALGGDDAARLRIAASILPEA